MKNILLLLLLTFTLSHAQEPKIDMHGGKNKSSTPIFYGKILQISSAMGYKYLKVDENGTTLWVAIANAPVNIGDTIGYDKQTIMTNFKSKTLGKTFEKVIFASDVYLPKRRQRVRSMKEMLGLTGTQNMTNPHKGMGVGLSPIQEEKEPALPFVEKPFYSVEEVFMWRKMLQGKTIKIKGKIYKVSHQIMKRDWVHLGDGSGDEKKLTDDLVFTTTSTKLQAGDEVIASGKVTVDKDFGYGYFYKVIMEDASFEVKRK